MSFNWYAISWRIKYEIKVHFCSKGPHRTDSDIYITYMMCVKYRQSSFKRCKKLQLTTRCSCVTVTSVHIIKHKSRGLLWRFTKKVWNICKYLMSLGRSCVDRIGYVLYNDSVVYWYFVTGFSCNRKIQFYNRMYVFAFARSLQK